MVLHSKTELLVLSSMALVVICGPHSRGRSTALTALLALAGVDCAYPVDVKRNGNLLSVWCNPERIPADTNVVVVWLNKEDDADEWVRTVDANAPGASIMICRGDTLNSDENFERLDTVFHRLTM